MVIKNSLYPSFFFLNWASVSTFVKFFISYINIFSGYLLHSNDTCIFFRTHWWWFGWVGSIVDHINEVNQHQAWLVLGWMTISVCNHPPRSTQPGHPSVGTSKSWDINRHTARCTSPVSVVSQCKNWCLVWLRAKETEISATLWALRLGKDFSLLWLSYFIVGFPTSNILLWHSQDVLYENILGIWLYPFWS